MVEHRTLNPQVLGSRPRSPTSTAEKISCTQQSVQTFTGNAHAQVLRAMNNEQTVSEASAIEITKTLLPDLEKLSKCASEPVAAVFIDSLLRKMRSLHDTHMDDPYTEVVMALHDALAHSNNWINYTNEQYQGAYNLFASLVNKEIITNTEVENSIIQMENLGFNTLPFGVKLE